MVGPMRLEIDGVQLFPAAFATDQLAFLATALEPHTRSDAGTRIGAGGIVPEAVAPATAIAAAFLGQKSKPVRATLFDKSPQRNWALGWHQDPTIAVRERTETAGFTAWTVKHGVHHVVPPFGYLERMLTLRIHLDPAGPDNAPLLVAPGSHRLGPVPEREIATAVRRCGTASCEAAAGDVWLYSTPILHASPRASVPARRRVLQLLYSADKLPADLEWLGV